MSDPDTKDTRGAPGRARATLAQLRQMSGRLVETDPERLVRHGLFGTVERWTRIRGTGSGALYELEGEH